ncbi:TM2 domain protein [Gleimia coleocanis DSM 15436]|uniref:TM2 domain protein n=1 Tax=Gleimia coleocanis DSM 15436 TaxID=525245 RepID=C0W0U1_9ACTO|nr:TM2 domain-containing protein [Gleimia coleocanis]EEH63665.1 TM2 domain protein [Gleimia coleocanis DSM 15436]
MSFDGNGQNPQGGYIPPVDPVQHMEPAGYTAPQDPYAGQQAQYGAPAQDPYAAQQAAYAQMPYANPMQAPVEQKSAIVAALLAFFLGTLGVHNFYLGYNKLGVIQLLLTLFGWILLFIPNIAVGIWVLVEMVLYLVSNEPRWRYDARGVLINR